MSFKEICHDQKLTIPFFEYSTVLTKMFNDCIRDPKNFVGTLTISKSRGRLVFTRKAEYKYIDLLTCDFTASSEEIVHQQIMYRYNLLKTKLALAQSRLTEIGGVIRVKNPLLLEELGLATKKEITVKK